MQLALKIVWAGVGRLGRRTMRSMDMDPSPSPLCTDIKTLQWSRIQKGCALRVERSDGSLVTFVGFRESDFGELSAAAPAKVAEVPASTSGHNWGRVSLQGSSLLFHVGDSPALCIPLPDVGQAQLGRDDVLLEFPVDDTADEQHDSLVELGFYVPREGAELSLHADDGSVVRVGQRVKAEEGEDGEKAEEGDEASAVIPAKVLYERVLEHSAAGLATGDAIVSFDQVGILVPRGRFDVEMYAGSLKLLGQTQDFRVSYSTILRVFVLPKSNVPQTLVAVSLDPPIRKGQTFYPHILCQFSSDEEVSVELAISEEALAAKNEKQGGRLQASYSGPAAEVFAKTLRGLSGAKLTKPGAFRDAEGSGFAVRCSYKADDGYLYPLERAFFYVHKPPLLVVFDEVDHVEFMRPAQGVTAAKTFDLAVRTNQGHEHLFRGIPRGEWTNLFEFIQAKQLRIENFKEAQRGPGATTVGYDLQGLDEGEEVERGMRWEPLDIELFVVWNVPTPAARMQAWTRTRRTRTLTPSRLRKTPRRARTAIWSPKRCGAETWRWQHECSDVRGVPIERVPGAPCAQSLGDRKRMGRRFRAGPGKRLRK